MKLPKIVEVGIYIGAILTPFLFAQRFYLIFLKAMIHFFNVTTKLCILLVGHRSHLAVKLTNFRHARNEENSPSLNV